MQVSEYNTLINTNIKRKILEGTIPIIVRIPMKTEEKYTLFNVNRNEYLPVLLKNALTEFLQETEQTMQSITYSVDEIPVKWYLPIGVIFDSIHNGSLPMEISIGIAPQQRQLFPYENEESMKNYFIQQMKEGCFLKYGSIQELRKLEVDLIDPLYQGHALTKLEEYDKLYSSITIGEEAWQHVPVHWYFGTQKHISDAIPTQIDDHLTTIHEAIEYIMKERVLTENDPEALRMLQNEDYAETLKFIVQGISVPPETPLLWMALNMSHSDGFVNICVRKESELLIHI